MIPGVVYQVDRWDQFFENSRSRAIESCTWVAIPNKHHGTGFQRIISSPDGMAIYGLWVLILQACSRQRASTTKKRNGWLTDDGTAQGHAWDVEDLAERWRQPVELVQRGLNLLSSQRIGWLLAHDALTLDATLDGTGRADEDEDEGDSLADGRRPSGDQAADGRQGGVGKKPRGAVRRERKGRELNGTPPTSATASSIFRVQAVDPEVVRSAVANQDLIEVVEAFGGNLDEDRPGEWARDSDQFTLHEIVAIFAWRRSQRDPIREPSGFRKVRDLWKAIPLVQRREKATLLLGEYGIVAPESKKAPHGEVKELTNGETEEGPQTTVVGNVSALPDRR